MINKDISYIINDKTNNSLLCYLLGITSLDPIKHNLILSYFIVKSDEKIIINIDFDYYKINLVLKRLREKWKERINIIDNKKYYIIIIDSTTKINLHKNILLSQLNFIN